MARHQRVGDDIARLRPSAIVLVAANWASAASCRNLGLRTARGDYVVTFAAPAQLEPGAFDSLVEAHDRGCAVVSGNIENLTDSAASWATFFADPGYASFAREPLLRAGGFDEWSVDGIEARARDRLLAAGHETASTSLLMFGHRSEFRNPDEYLRACVERGRAIARDSQRAGAARGVVGRVARREAERVAASWKDADRRTSELADRFRRVRSVVVGSAAAVCAGTALERMLERVPQRALAAQGVSVPQPAPAPEPVALTAVPHVPFRTRRTGLRIAIANFGTPASGGLDYGASWEDVELPRQGPHVGLFDQDVKWGFHLYAPGIHLRGLGLADIVEFWNFGPKRTMSFLSNGVLKVTFHDEYDVAAYLARFGPPDLFVNHGARGVPVLRTLEGRTFRVHVPTYRTNVSKPLADAECFLLDAEWQLVDRSMLYIPVVDTERFRPGDGNTERDFVYLASCYSGKRHDLIVDAVRGTEITGHLHPVAPTALDLSGTKITTSDLDERDPVEIVQRSRIAVYPADETSNPAAMWECVAAGLPIVMNEAIAGGKHLVVPGVTGEFAPEEHFLDVMRDVLARRHDYAPREHFEANWDTVTLIEGYLRFFQEMGWNA